MLGLAEPSALLACEVCPAEPAREEPAGAVPEVLCPEATPPEMAQEKQTEGDPSENVTKKPRTVPILIVPPNWDVPIQQKMVNIFAPSKKPVASSANAAEGAQVVDLDGSDGEQAKCSDELDVESEDGEPPVTLRKEQWTLRPKTSRGRGKGRGRGRGRGKRLHADDGEPGTVQSSGEEAEAEMRSVADVKPKRPRAKAKTRKEKPVAPKAAPKRRGKKKPEEKKPEEVAVSAEADAVENNGDQEMQQPAAVENHVEEDGGWGCLSFVLANVEWSNRWLGTTIKVLDCSFTSHFGL